MKRELRRQIFEKHLNIKFHENPFNGSRVVPCGRTDGHAGKHEEAKVAFRNFQTAPRYVRHVKLLQATTVVQTIVFRWDLQVLVDTFISMFNEINGH